MDAIVVDVHVTAMDVVVTNLPPGSVVRVHGAAISGEFAARLHLMIRRSS